MNPEDIAAYQAAQDRLQADLDLLRTFQRTANSAITPAQVVAATKAQNRVLRFLLGDVRDDTTL
jgi:hypothetical protein